MKKNLLLFSALAAMVFTACQSDEPAVDNGGEEATTGEQYMAVRISTAGMNGSRSAEFDDFEVPADGSQEGTVTAENIRFYFFNASGEPFVMSLTGVDGTVSNTNMVKPTSIAANNTNGAAGTIEAVLVLNGYKGNKPARVFCVANAHALGFEEYANIPLNNLLNYSKSASVGATTWTTFTMTSSTYVENGTIKYWSDIAKDNIADDATTAKDNPVDIYLERLAVKVRANGLREYTAKTRNADGTLSDQHYIIRSLDADGNEEDFQNQTLTVELTGWKILDTPLRSYAVKHLQDEWLTTDPFLDWNNVGLHRSYWAYSQCSGGTGTLDNTTYDIKEASQFTLTNFATDNPTENILYCYEYTRGTASSVTDRAANTTALLVRGIVKLNGVAADLCEWGGDMYTTARLKKIIADTYNTEYGSNYTAADVKFISKSESTKANRWVATVGTTEYTRFDNISWWDAGQTSYRVNIEHQTVTTGEGDAAVTTPLFGVVRNHIYDYTFTNVVGLGVPGNDHENPDPLSETYLAARINVLNWHVVSNSIVLE